MACSWTLVQGKIRWWAQINFIAMETLRCPGQRRGSEEQRAITTAKAMTSLGRNEPFHFGDWTSVFFLRTTAQEKIMQILLHVTSAHSYKTAYWWVQNKQFRPTQIPFPWKCPWYQEWGRWGKAEKMKAILINSSTQSVFAANLLLTYPDTFLSKMLIPPNKGTVLMSAYLVNGGLQTWAGSSLP